jgi:hypothetical protein
MTGRRLLQQQLHMLPSARRRRQHFSNPAVVDFAGEAAQSAFGQHHNNSRHLQQQQQQSNISGTLQDTICLVPETNWPTDWPPDITFGCQDPQPRPYPVGFHPVEVPVVFHCEWGHLLQAQRPQLLRTFELCYIVSACTNLLGRLSIHPALPACTSPALLHVSKIFQ